VKRQNATRVTERYERLEARRSMTQHGDLAAVLQPSRPPHLNPLLRDYLCFQIDMLDRMGLLFESTISSRESPSIGFGPEGYLVRLAEA
jgi:hypothetical protein